MNVSKYETNQRRNLFMHETSNVKFKEDTSNVENNVINIYPDIEFQEFLGFGRRFNWQHLL